MNVSDPYLPEKQLLVNDKNTYGFSAWYFSFLHDWLTNLHFQYNYCRNFISEIETVFLETAFLPGSMPTVPLYRETFS